MAKTTPCELLPPCLRCGTINDPSLGSLSTICCSGLEGRYVTIVIPGRAEYLSLCEVEVLSQGCITPPGAQNLALRRQAAQSSSFLGTIFDMAGNAVDGNRNGVWERGSCSLTKRDTEPWWTVDLGRRHSVSMVMVKNREDGSYWKRLKGAEIHVGDSLTDNGKSNPLCGTINDTRPGSLSTICCNGRQGRYVTTTIPGRAEYLSLCEVEVLSQSCVSQPRAFNLALGRPATQSSTLANTTGQAVAGRAVDGKHDGKLEQGSCSQTQRDMEPWWNVDLVSRYSVSMVIVKHLEDECCGERLKGAEIHVGDSLVNHGKNNPLCGTITDIVLGSLAERPLRQHHQPLQGGAPHPVAPAGGERLEAGVTVHEWGKHLSLRWGQGQWNEHMSPNKLLWSLLASLRSIVSVPQVSPPLPAPMGNTVLIPRSQRGRGSKPQMALS
nr:uncharacterized protein LOC106732561 isoform X1 [Pelodiscus sinensis]|eukprot:XP_014433016.2 uncharacterized protein LOC106732561 isoform X1 [Pelodiscus sinensis]